MTEVLTFDKLKATIDAVCRLPPLYYATTPWVKPGTVYVVPEDERGGWPEYAICHPDDVEAAAKALSGDRRLVHLRAWRPSRLPFLLSSRPELFPSWAGERIGA